MLSLYKIKNTDTVETDKGYTDIGLGYYYDLKQSNLFYKNQPIQLSQNEKKLLQLLVEAKGVLVTLQTIEENIWPNKTISSSAIRTLVYRLRSKLEFKLIETIPSFGCKLHIH